MVHPKLHTLEAMPVSQAILKLAVPTMLGMLAQVFYNMTDTFFVRADGRFVPDSGE